MVKKIRVEFELNLKDVKKLIKSGAKGKMLSKKEVDKLIKKGVIRASDYLDKRQLVSAASIPAYVDKVDKVTDKAVEKIEPIIVEKTYQQSYEKSFAPTQKKQSGSVAESRGKDFPKK